MQLLHYITDLLHFYYVCINYTDHYLNDTKILPMKYLYYLFTTQMLLTHYVYATCIQFIYYLHSTMLPIYYLCGNEILLLCYLHINYYFID